MLVKHISERPVPVEQRRADVPTDLARSVMMLLEKEPANRFPTASALVAALDSRDAPPPRAAAPSATGAPNMSSAPYSPPAPRPTYAPESNRPYAPMPYPGDSRPLASAVTNDERIRWEEPPVVQFRKKIAPYLFVNGVIVLFSLFGSSDFFFMTVLWSIYIAFKYAKLWSDGYDWRDVFRQPRDRELMEVVEEGVEYLRALFDPRARERLRAARAQRKLAARDAPARLPSGFEASRGLPLPPTVAQHGAEQLSGPYGERARQAVSDCDEILRRLKELPRTQREQFNDVGPSAVALANKVQELALAQDELARQDLVSAHDALEQEITTLENAANPLERGSEDRVRRLAHLKRQRRALVDAEKRKQSLAAKLETCAVALHDMRLNLMRLGASPQMNHQITSLVNQAMKLTENVDDALFVADEMGRVGGNRPAETRHVPGRG
jgi:serine/threonine-protein kinase